MAPCSLARQSRGGGLAASGARSRNPDGRRRGCRAHTGEEVTKFIEGAVSDERRHELLARALIIAQDTAMRDKRRALGRALANGVADQGTMVDQELLFIRVLADLDEPHIRVLRIMNTTPPHLDAMRREMQAVGRGDIRQWYPWSIAKADPGLSDSVWALLRVLEKNNLAWSSGEQLTPTDMEPEYSITPYGEWFLERLSDPATQP
jgi:hypothetical protein